MGPVPGLAQAAPFHTGGVTVYGLTLGAIELVALGLGVLWSVVNGYQFYPVVQSAVERAAERVAGGPPPRPVLDDAALPEIDVVLPAYREGAVVEQSIRSVRAADYPQDRLHLYVVVEAGDADTRGVLAGLADVAFTELAVPASYPGEPNKPRALNYAFEATDAAVVGLVDAEDLVAPTLFREAVARLRTDCDFVQARLDMVNEADGWLNTLFRAEYGFWYRVVLPAFQRVGYPVPLAGTSCLFRRSALVAADVERRERYGDGLARDGRLWTGRTRLFGWTPWDPANVTEDFELGLFLWERGLDVGYLEATTAEESPLSLDDWMKQRTRWKKGKLQTFGKYVEAPPAGWRVRAHLLWQSCLPHVGPINVCGVLLLLALANLAKYDPGTVVGGVLSLGLAFVVVTTSLYAYGYWLASDAPGHVRARRTAVVVLTLPLYWLLQWLADVRALRQSYLGRWQWERVEHHGRNASGSGRSPPSLGPTRVLPGRVRAVALAAIVAVAAALRLVDLGRISLWTDEVYAVAGRGSAPLARLLFVPSDPHPPLYYLLLHAWMALVGANATGARALSAGCSVAAIVVLYRLGTELFDDRVGLVAAALVALSSFDVHYGRTARMYSLFGLFAVLSWLAFARLRLGRGRDVAWYVLATAAMLYTHVFGVFVVAAQYGFLALSESRAGVARPTWRRAQAGLLLLASPVLAFLGWEAFRPLLAPGSNAALSWIPIPSTVAVTATVLGFLGYPGHYPVVGVDPLVWGGAGALGFVALGAVVLALVGYRPDDGYRLTASIGTGQAVALAVVPIAVPFLASYLVAPMYAPRYTYPASYGVTLLVAAGATNVPRPRTRRVLLAVLLLGSAALLGAYFATGTVENWRGATDRLEVGAGPGDLLVLQPGWIEPSVDYYYDGPALARLSLPADATSRSASARLRSRASDVDHVWVVQYRGAPTAGVRSALAGRPRLVVFQQGDVRVTRYDRGS